MSNRICELFHIAYPVIQGGMVWCSGWRLASAVSNAGGLGVQCIRKCCANIFKSVKQLRTSLSA